MLVLECMMQLTMPAFKSTVIHTLVKISVTHDHIRCKQVFVSSWAQKQIKWQATGVQCIKDHLSITSAGFSKRKLTICTHCSGSSVFVLQNHLCWASKQVYSPSAQDGLTMKRQSRCRRQQGSWCFHHTGHKHQKHIHHISHPCLWDLQDTCSTSGSRSWGLWCLQNGKGRQHDS